LNAKLDALELPQGAAIGCVLRNQPGQIGALLGVLVGERCVVTLNPVIPDEKLADDIRRQKPPVIVANAQDWAREPVRRAAQDIGALGLLVGGEEPLAVVAGLETVGPGPHMPPQPGVAILMLTSGTTGEPKRAPLGYQQLEIQIKRSTRGDPTRKPDDPPMLRDGFGIHHSPLVHISGAWGLLLSVTSGRSLFLMEKFSVPEWREAVAKYRPAGIGGPPAVLRMILDANIPREDLASVKAIGTGTAAVSPETVDEFLKRYDIPVLSTYGATEFAGGVAGWSVPVFRKYWAAKRGAAGRLNPGVEARTVDPETFEVLPPGSSGLLELRASVVGDGATWTRTSDLARTDSDYFLWILGRNDNAIIRGGFKVRPDDVVSALHEHPAIFEASVIGLPDRRLGQIPVAAIVLRDGAAQPGDDDLAAFLRERLTSYQIPVRFKFVDELPRTPSLKVSMPMVRALFEDET
jgi:acyl-CoA synthetase (AMP-forming)/AMP-acid ligase II